MNRLLALVFYYFLLSTGMQPTASAQSAEISENALQLKIDSILVEVRNSEGDSNRIDKILDLVWKNIRNQPKISLALLDTLDLFYEKSMPSGYKQSTTLYYKGIVHKNMGNTVLAEQYIQSYIDQMKAKGHTRRVLAGMQALGNLYTNMNLYDKAIGLYTKALESMPEQTDSVSLARIFTRLSFFLSKVKRFDEALDYNQSALDLLGNNQSGTNYINTINDRGIIYETMERWDSMVHYYQLNLKLSEQSKDISNLLYAHYNLGAGFQKTKDNQKANFHFQKSLELAQRSSNKIMEMYTLIGLADVSLEQKKYNQALRYLAPLDQEELANDLVHAQEEIRSSIYQKLGNYEAAFNSLKRSREAKKALDSLTTLSEIVAIENKYDRKQKELKILQLASDKQVADLAAEKANQRSFFLFGTLLIALLIGAGFAYFYYLKKRTNDQLNEKNKIISMALDEKELLLQEIHHRVKNNLQMVSSLLSLQSRAQDSASASQALEEGQLRVQSMALIHQHLYSGANAAGVKMKAYLEHLCQDIFTSHNIKEDQVQLELDIDDLDLDISTVVPLGLIFNELITNACKYAFPDERQGKITVSLAEKDDTLIASVADDGVGDVKENKGFGSRLVAIFSQKMNAEIVRKSDHGLRYDLFIKNYKKL